MSIQHLKDLFNPRRFHAFDLYRKQVDRLVSERTETNTDGRVAEPAATEASTSL